MVMHNKVAAGTWTASAAAQRGQGEARALEAGSRAAWRRTYETRERHEPETAEELAQELARSKSLQDPRKLRQVTLVPGFVSTTPTATAAATTTTSSERDALSQHKVAGMKRVDSLNDSNSFCNCFVAGYGNRKLHLIKKGFTFSGCVKYISKDIKGMGYSNFFKPTSAAEAKTGPEG
mmetsp:Transcript_17530/g.53452  ORF Transcript_17530/g.53452 Transcript_17530/m.53452 type:complete len:178 (-) Transcript_17530:310-843(-)|eukprot:CAMPEP_0198652208 /NCGR_PEP_ID=MMETSP1467-20131203/6216_1 /TAXON_ID=1462469 /ORGANISM="unid. sp., Strain CCMP2135" /LENGTH=177 /DNA_ID=CAMNT_0044388117 /DNA_START=231 /DNA_END=764 /DNA_ORIENTATION=+